MGAATRCGRLCVTADLSGERWTAVCSDRGGRRWLLRPGERRQRGCLRSACGRGKMNVAVRAGASCVAGIALAAAIFAKDLPPGKAKPLIERACTTCHEINIGEKQRMGQER